MEFQQPAGSDRLRDLAAQLRHGLICSVARLGAPLRGVGELGVLQTALIDGHQRQRQQNQEKNDDDEQRSATLLQTIYGAFHPIFLKYTVWV